MCACRDKSQLYQWMDFSIFVILILLVVLLYQKHEDYRIFQSLIKEANASSNHVANFPAETSPQKEALAILHQVYKTLMPRWTELTTQGRTRNITLFTPSQVHLNEPLGACASFSHVLARTLRQAGYPLRKIGLSRDGIKGIHHVLEVQINGRWVLMDAFYDLTFVQADGFLADAASVGADWDHYQQQVPSNYDPNFDYSGYYYTNWSKVPGFKWVTQLLPSFGVWLEDEKVSVQFIFLDIKSWYIGTLMGVAFALLWYRLKRQPQVDATKTEDLNNPLPSPQYP